METITKHFKVVKTDEHNCDEYLLGFYYYETQAQDAKTQLYVKHKNWIRANEYLVVKPVIPDMITMPVSTDYSHYIRSLIPDDEWERVMSSDAKAEISENDLVCGGAAYYNLSKMIPKDWCVIDIGSGYNAQSYLFKDHAKYIAVEPYPRVMEDFVLERFKAHGTELYEMTCGEFIKDVLPTLNLNLNKTFAICNFVPCWHNENPIELVRHTFRNVFTYYPA